jgi:hypothetical protein
MNHVYSDKKVVGVFVRFGCAAIFCIELKCNTHKKKNHYENKNFKISVSLVNVATPLTIVEEIKTLKVSRLYHY